MEIQKYQSSPHTQGCSLVRYLNRLFQYHFISILTSLPPMTVCDLLGLCLCFYKPDLHYGQGTRTLGTAPWAHFSPNEKKMQVTSGALFPELFQSTDIFPYTAKYNLVLAPHWESEL